MNDLLQRLVQRTVGHSAAVEPLYTPRYSVAGASPGGNREIEVVNDPPMARKQSIAPVTAMQKITPSTSTPEPSAGLLETVTMLETGDTRAVEFRSPSVTDARTVPPRANETSEGYSSTSNGQGRLRSWQTVTAQENTAAAGKIEVAAKRTSQPLRGDEHAHKLSGNREQTNSPSASPLFAPRDAPSMASGQPADASASSPRDITISIGHIEVRNVPAPAKLRRPPFRPRVTLDEFLKGQPGDRR